jgi:glyceraldehyde-3-phosphate dehydrogenase (NAD(P))
MEAYNEFRQKTQSHPLGGFGLFDVAGFPKVVEWEKKYLSPEKLEKYDQSIGVYDPRVGHQGKDAGTVFKDVRFSVRASKVPTTMPHVHQANMIFEGDVTPSQLIENLSKTRETVVMPYEDSGRKHEWTSEILEAFISSEPSAIPR